MKKIPYKIALYSIFFIAFLPFHTLMASSTSKIPKWVKRANAYEVNLRQFTKEGTVTAFSDQLARLKEMGVDILVFLPVYSLSEEHPGGPLAEVYSIRDYRSFNHEFGSVGAFKEMVDKAHQMGMHVVLDWEPEHTAPDHIWKSKHPEWFSSASSKEGVLDYDNEDMCSEIKDAMHYWVDEIGIDGYRCFHAKEVPEWFWTDIWEELETKRPLLGIATVEDPQLFEAGFDMLMSTKLYDILLDMAKEGKGGLELESYMKWRKELPGGEHLFMNYITNYQLNTTKGPLRDRIGNRTKMLSILTVLLDGVPLVMNGQEAGLSNALPCCEKTVIPWYSYIRAPLFTKLFELRHQHPAMEGAKYVPLTTNSGGTVVAFMRQSGKHRMIYSMNLEDRHYIFQYTTKVPEDLPMIDYFTGEPADIPNLNKQYTTAGRMEYFLWITPIK